MPLNFIDSLGSSLGSLNILPPIDSARVGFCANVCGEVWSGDSMPFCLIRDRGPTSVP